MAKAAPTVERTAEADAAAALQARVDGDAGRAAVWIARLRLSNVRNYARAEVTSDGRPVVLTGPNGAGKTNLLEAVSFLAPGRGLRRARLEDVQRHAGGNAPAAGAGWAVAARVQTADGPRELGTGRDPAGGTERRVVKIDGSHTGSQQALGEVLAVTWLTPQMDRLFQEAPAGRRRFLDRLVYGVDPAHAGRVSAYERALRERARLLRERGPGADPAWLGALEERMAERGVAIAAARREMVTRLARCSAAADGPFPKVGLGLAGELEQWLDDGPALAAEERLRRELAAARGRDAETGGAAVGPHRSDLAARHQPRDLPAELCSTGEQKALLVAIVLAHARLIALERGEAPLVLLDEVAAHLDAERRASLFEELLGLGCQAWLTGTDAGLFDGLVGRAQFMEVRDGAVRVAAATSNERG